MIEVLKPLKVRAGNTTSVCEQVGNDNNASFFKHVLSAESCRAVSTFNYDLAVQLVSIVLVDCLFFSGRN